MMTELTLKYGLQTQMRKRISTEMKAQVLHENDRGEYFHCVKSVQIRSYFWSVFSCIRTGYRKLRTRNNSVFGHFSRTVYVMDFSITFQIWVGFCVFVT